MGVNEEHQRMKDEDHGQPVLPPLLHHVLPRVSIPTSPKVRARLSHRKPILSSSFSSSSVIVCPGDSPTPSHPITLPSTEGLHSSMPSISASVAGPSLSFIQNCADTQCPVKLSPDFAHELPISLECFEATTPNDLRSDDLLGIVESSVDGSPGAPTLSVLGSCDTNRIVSSGVLHSGSLTEMKISPSPLPNVNASPSYLHSIPCQSNQLEDGVFDKDKGLLDILDDSKVPEINIPGDNLSPSRDLDISMFNTILPNNVFEGANVCLESNVSLEQKCRLVPYATECSDVVTTREVVADELELEDGQLPGEWSGDEELRGDLETHQAAESVPVQEDKQILHGVVTTALGRKTENIAVHPNQRNGGKTMTTGKKKKKKHKKGEGSKKRAREKSKDKYNELQKKRKSQDNKGENPHNTRGALKRKSTHGSNGMVEVTVSKVVSSTKVNGDVVDEEPEEGEILLEPTGTNTGILSSLVEAEVGLWTTDDVDDQFVTQMEEDGACKKKRGPETAERKLKRKIVKRKKRAQKERELGIRRPSRTLQSKPVKVLCTHYMKGRCAKGEMCGFSHDAVPLTKQEPCKFLMSHSCLKGDDCPYSHDLQAFPCKFFHTRGLCYDGTNCQFSHAAISEEAMEKLHKRVEKEKRDRSTSAIGFDIPLPEFSTPLPPDMDPDPLGWGTPSSYPGSGGILSSNSMVFDRSTYPDNSVNHEIHSTQWVSMHMTSGPATVSQSVNYIAENEIDVVSPVPQNVGAKLGVTMQQIAKPLSQPDLSMPESPNARNVLQEEEVPVPKSCQDHMSNETIGQSREQVVDSQPCPSVLPGPGPAPASCASGLLVPVLGRSQLNKLWDSKKAQLAPRSTTSRRLSTVDSLLNEALRQ